MLPVTEEWFWGRVHVCGEDECWPWVDSTIKKYGCFYVKGKRHRAHRVAYELTKGEIPEGLGILHSCDNPPCCNPRHLRTGTQTENNADMLSKGRGVNRKGIDHGGARLTESDVRRIRQLRRTKQYTLSDLAQMFGVSFYTIHDVAKRRTWTHVED